MSPEKGMFDTLKELDTDILLFFNSHNSPFLDQFFFLVSNKWVWIPFYIYLAYDLYKRNRGNFLFLLIFIAFAITLSDQISSSFLKEVIMRLRPCHDPRLAGRIHLVNGYCGGMYGFVSSHAGNTFALVMFLVLLHRTGPYSLKYILWPWAALVSFSRIYLGVHYPGDILGGAMVGILSGYFSWFLFQKFIRYYCNKIKPDHVV